MAKFGSKGDTLDPITLYRLLGSWRAGERRAMEPLHLFIFNELRVLASRAIRLERAGHTLQPSALVNEVFLELMRAPQLELRSRAHFFGIAANLMRQILIQDIRRRTALKRGGAEVRVSLDEASVLTDPQQIHHLDLHRALESLRRIEPRQAQIVRLRYFLGLEIREIAQKLRISTATVKRDWSAAKAWLHQRLERAR